MSPSILSLRLSATQPSATRSIKGRFKTLISYQLAALCLVTRRDTDGCAGRSSARGRMDRCGLARSAFHAACAVISESAAGNRPNISTLPRAVRPVPNSHIVRNAIHVIEYGQNSPDDANPPVRESLTRRRRKTQTGETQCFSPRPRYGLSTGVPKCVLAFPQKNHSETSICRHMGVHLALMMTARQMGPGSSVC